MSFYVAEEFTDHERDILRRYFTNLDGPVFALVNLPEVVKGVAGRVPVLIDGGVRRGTDVYKALALGATAVGIGRPYIWGLASFGQPGVERVLDIVNNELRLAMVGCGARNIAEISPASLIDTQHA